MKKLIIIVAVIAVLAVSAFFGVSAFAAGNLATTTPPTGTAADGTSWTCPGWGNGNGTYTSPEFERISAFLGLTPEDLTAQLQAGKTLAQIAESKNISRQALLDAILAPSKDQLQLDVKYGYRTQAQADAYLQQETTGANAFMDRVLTNTTAPGQGYGSGCGQGYGGGGMMGRSGGCYNNPGSPQDPNSTSTPGGNNGRGWGMMGGGMMGRW